MKTITKAVLGFGILASGLTFAQETEKFDNPGMKNMIKIGATVGIAVPQENASAAVGLDVAYQNLVTPGFGLGVATGYTHYFGRSNGGMENNDFGVVPVAGLIRIYPKDTGFYFGTDLGYGFIVGDEAVASNDITNTQRPDGGLYLKPEIGYHNNDWNFSLHYQKVFTGDNGEIGSQKFSAGSLGLGVSYNIPLGQ
ncbi:hypothetical protein H1R16_03740 [Marnyiella aurantia]|uniref:Outer membrane beta-barrel protein n=1 Tax=Marnyiella aurantia TaxID=2758037 RepID=A0A7D7R6W1_9FLAO|nr:hypothetical protein [Marnyiella aurantia]MBA5247370.1 hypothetical protein [Marnyiella aurantia]MBP0613023.1 hypothetical protein [Marnyiella aurantia]QMS99129.1 hypothetical protein H1R16_03740 [Marnyiella aurantia]